jgi:alpha-tubulin suppressor-like RCC1 family protein
MLLVVLTACHDAPTEPVSAPETNLSPSAAATTLSFYQVSAGESHTCGVTTDNRAYCWGSNRGGQLGDGTTTDRLTPVPVAGGFRFHQISAGGQLSTCAVTTDNRVYCWGTSSSGVLGDGTSRSQRFTPVPVAGGHRFRQVDVGLFHACALTYPDPSQAYCWGANYYGELGDGTRTDRSVPVAVKGSLLLRQVSAGANHSCGITTGYVTYCWGTNRAGQLGDSSTVLRRPTPSRVVGAHRFRSLDAGDEHTCAVTTSNRAYCWGNGRGGTIGDGHSHYSYWPRAVLGGLLFTRVTGGSDHTCGETTDNRAYCWGRNGSGGLGDGTTTQRLTPVAVAGGHVFKQVSAGAHTCGKTDTSVAYCWGWNGNGQLGDGTKTTRLKPVRVAAAP